MDNLTRQYEKTERALATIDRAFRVLKKARAEKDIDEILVAQDSAIQRFEYSTEQFWKFVRLFLIFKYSITENSPKSVFRTCFKLKLFSEEETQYLLDMIDDRNTTVHEYDEDKACSIMSDIEKYAGIMKTLLARLKQNYNQKKNHEI